MIFLKQHEALRIPGIHFSPQHHADSKGKPEGRIIGDLSGQHDENFTPLNGSANDKDKLRDAIEQQWGAIRHPTVEMLVKMVLTSADLHGWDNIILWKKDLKGAFNLLNFSYTLHGDNMSSLAWAKADRVNSTLARRANIVFTTVSMHINASLSDTQHIPGIMNVLFDGLSRHVSPTELGLDPTLMFNAADDVSILRFVQLCDPALELSDIASHNDLLHQCTMLLLT